MVTGPLQLSIGDEGGFWLPEGDAGEVVGYLDRFDGLHVQRYGTGLQFDEGVQEFKRLVATLATFRERAIDGTTERRYDAAAGLSLRDLVDVVEAAAILGCGARNVRALAERGTLPPVARHPLQFDRADVLERAARRHRRAS